MLHQQLRRSQRPTLRQKRFWQKKHHLQNKAPGYDRGGPPADRGRRDWVRRILHTANPSRVFEVQSCGVAVREDAAKLPCSQRTTLRQNWCWKKRTITLTCTRSKVNKAKTKHQGPVETSRADLDRYSWVRLILKLFVARTRVRWDCWKRRLTVGSAQMGDCTRGSRCFNATDLLV